MAKPFIVTRTGRVVHRANQSRLAVVHQVPGNWKLWTYSPNCGTETYPTRPRAAQAAWDAQMQIMDWFARHMAERGAPVGFEHGKQLDQLAAFADDQGAYAETVDCPWCLAPAGQKCIRPDEMVAEGASKHRSPHRVRVQAVTPVHRFVEMGEKGPHCVNCRESAYAAGPYCGA